MSLNEFKAYDLDKLKSKLISLYREKLKINFDMKSNSDFNKTHLLKKNRKDIARILTLISEKRK